MPDRSSARLFRSLLLKSLNLDQFVNLLIEHQNSAPDAAKLKAAYMAYLEKLKRAD